MNSTLCNEKVSIEYCDTVCDSEVYFRMCLPRIVDISKTDTKMKINMTSTKGSKDHVSIIDKESLRLNPLAVAMVME